MAKSAPNAFLIIFHTPQEFEKIQDIMESLKLIFAGDFVVPMEIKTSFVAKIDKVPICIKITKRNWPKAIG